MAHSPAAPVCNVEQVSWDFINFIRVHQLQIEGGRGSWVTKQKVTIEKMRTVAILILAVAAIAAQGETRVFKVSGTGWNSYNGLYAEDEAGTHFTKIGGADSEGNHGYLWHDQGRWKIAWGKTFYKESNLVYFYN